MVANGQARDELRAKMIDFAPRWMMSLTMKRSSVNSKPFFPLRRGFAELLARKTEQLRVKDI
jgi:hypothetical protein